MASKYWEYTNKQLPEERERALDLMKYLCKYGWELVCVDQGLAYFRREVAKSQLDTPHMLAVEERLARENDW